MRPGSGDLALAWASATLRRGNPAAWWLLRLLAPAAGFEQFCRVYGYFRWADDIVDAPQGPERNRDQIQAFVQEQSRAWQPVTSTPAVVGPGPLALHRALELQPELAGAVTGMWEALAFDAMRGPEPRTTGEVEAQLVRIGDAYAVGLATCLGVGEALARDNPHGNAIRQLARAATRVHQVRDLWIDRELGYCNVPAEDLDALGVRFEVATVAVLAPWVTARCQAVLPIFRAGDEALRTLQPWRARWVFRIYGWRYARLARALANRR